MVEKEARRMSRILAVEAFFSYLERGQAISIQECFSHALEEVEERTADAFAKDLVEKAAENTGKMKVVIRAFAPEFPFEKIAPINRAILVLGLTEMKFLDTPPIVVINEYIEIAKLFGEQKSASFINAVLDNFRKEIGLKKDSKDKE